MSRIYLAHITVYDAALPGTTTLYFCSGNGFVTGTDAALRPPGIGAHVYYEPRIKQPASMRRDCFSKGATGGASTISYGELVLVNNDGALDGFLEYGLDGQPIEILIGEMLPWQTPIYSTVLKGTMDQPRISRDAVSIRLRDRQAELDKPAQPLKYAGNNALPNGLEGVAGDLQGKPKPILFGKCFNLAPPGCNTSKLCFQVNSGAVADVVAVYDRGVALTKGANYATSALLLAATPGAGTYITCFAEGYFRLGSSPAGIVTADVTQGAAAGNRTAAQIAKLIALAGGIAAGDITAADITALDAANSAEIGIYTDTETTPRALLDEVCAAVGAWWGFDRLGKFRVQRIELPSGTPVAVLTDTEILSFDRVESADEGKGIPAWRVKLRYLKNHTVQTTDLAGAVTDARRGELAQTYRETVAEDAAVKTAHLLAPELVYDSLLVDAAAAATEAARRLTLYKSRRDRFEARVALDSTLAATIDLGSVVSVVYARFGLAAGKDFRVIGLQPDLRTNQIALTLWA